MSPKSALILRDWTLIRCNPDLKIIGKSGQYNCHRIVILCLSPYFQKLLHYSRQSVDGYHVLDLTDIETPILLSIINFAYRSVLDVNKDNVEDLMITADKYNIMSIMKRCQHFLWKTIDSDNCIDGYLLAHFYNCRRLKNRIKEFIVGHNLISRGNGDSFADDLTDEEVLDEWRKKKDKTIIETTNE